MNRRQWVLGGVAVGAAVAGGGVAVWRSTRAASEHAAADAAAESALWAMRFTEPGGSELAMASFRSKPLLLNFWATWCAPCIKEMPLLDAFFKQHRTTGWQVVGLAVDSPTPVREYLAKLPMAFPIGLAGMDGVDLARSLGNANGALPFSVVFDRMGRLIDRKLGQVDQADMARWLKSAG